MVELLKGLPKHGPILLNLIDEDDLDNCFDGFPAVTSPNGSYLFTNTYDLEATAAFGEGFGAEDLVALEFREIVIHGAFLAPGVGGLGSEAEEDPTILAEGGYSFIVPVASGEIVQVDAPAPIPLPAAAWMLMAGIGGIGALRLRKRAA